MTRVIWLTAGTLVAGRVVADLLDTSCELDPRRVVAVLFLGLLFAAGVATIIRKGEP